MCWPVCDRTRSNYSFRNDLATHFQTLQAQAKGQARRRLSAESGGLASDSATGSSTFGSDSAAGISNGLCPLASGTSSAVISPRTIASTRRVLDGSRWMRCRRSPCSEVSLEEPATFATPRIRAPWRAVPISRRTRMPSATASSVRSCARRAISGTNRRVRDSPGPILATRLSKESNVTFNCRRFDTARTTPGRSADLPRLNAALLDDSPVARFTPPILVLPPSSLVVVALVALFEGHQVEPLLARISIDPNIIDTDSNELLG